MHSRDTQHKRVGISLKFDFIPTDGKDAKHNKPTLVVNVINESRRRIDDTGGAAAAAAAATRKTVHCISMTMAMAWRCSALIYYSCSFII